MDHDIAIDPEIEAEIRARIVNLTPHVVRLLVRKHDGTAGVLAVLDPAPVPARVEMAPGVAINQFGWTRLSLRTAPVPGDVVGLPPRAAADVPAGNGLMAVPPSNPVRLYIVSAIVAQALRGRGRDDVFTVGTGPRDIERRDGQVWGTYALEQVPQ